MVEEENMVTIKIETDNAAFEELHTETARILRVLADRIDDGETSGNLFDVNGNRVGCFEVTR